MITKHYFVKETILLIIRAENKKSSPDKSDELLIC